MLTQANLIASWADAMEKANDGPDNPWAAAIAQFYELYKSDGKKWVKKEASFQFAVNQTATVRRETLGGVEYLVAPMVAIKAGVLNDELVPEEEIGKYLKAWAGRPFVIGHPKADDGADVTANDPRRLAQISIGQFFPLDFKGGKLHGEIWTDIKKAKHLGGDAQAVLMRLQSGTPLEVSTAYFRDLEEKAGEYEGQPYVGIARNLRPDHVAALLHTEGACSWADGCGAPRVNEEGDMEVNVRSAARTPSYDGVETTSWADVAKTFQAYRDGYYKHRGNRPDDPDDIPSRVQDAPAAMRAWIASKTLLGEADAELERDLLMFPVVNPSTDKLNAGAVRAVLGGRGASAKIPAGALKSAQDKARSLLENVIKADSDQSKSKLRQAFETIANALKITVGGGKMGYVESIVNDGRLGLKAEQLEGLDEEALKALAAFLEKVPAEEPPETDEQEDSDEQEDTDEEPGCNEAPNVGEAMDAAFADLGGVEGVKGILAGLKADADQRKAELIGKLKANAQCAFTEDRLKAMELDDLEALHRTLAPADYRGQGGGPVANTEKAEALKMPSLYKEAE